MLDWIVVNLPIILCFIFGVVFLVLEAFMPGFGIPGIIGIVLNAISVALTWSKYGPVAGLGVALIVFALLAIAITVSLRSATRGRISKSPIILNKSESTEDGYNAIEDFKKYIGKEGTVQTTLRPTGMAEIDGERVNVVSDGEYIATGSKIYVDRVEGAKIIVRIVE